MTPTEVFLRLVHGVADGDYANLPGLYAEQTDVRHPFAPGGDHPLLTRDALREHFGGTGPKVAQAIAFEPDNIRVHETADPEVIVAEFEYAGTRAADGASFRVPCIFVLRVRDGLIVESRDYVDHVGMARARGTLDQLFAVAREPRGPVAAS
ncbi:nuclear transport factor 2 family protein [Kribbella italica]|uniref:Ketosteroid isomerase-like protein n=1 Tax=Kribbella italica TaxID=1540520 RepID=A0A7W9JAG1_9ACTN|nr:nuclear transport factor 2 family protein [Kribbella italica]MBB5838137.1 ketosteroid isomerase-like protein [Kribbella italica]